MMELKEDIQRMLEQRVGSLYLRVCCRVDGNKVESDHRYEVVQQGEIWNTVEDRSTYAISLRMVDAYDLELCRVWNAGEGLRGTTAYHGRWWCITCHQGRHDDFCDRIYFDELADILTLAMWHEREVEKDEMNG